MKRATLVMLAFLPFLPALNIGSFDVHAVRVAAPLLAAGFFVSGLVRRTTRIPLHSAWWFFFAFLSLTTLSALWAQDPATVFRKAVLLWGVGAAAAYLGFVVAAWDTGQWVGRGFLVAALMAGSAGVVQFFAQFALGSEKVITAIKTISPWLWGESTSNAAFAFPSFFVGVGSKTLLRAFFPFPDPHTLGLFLGITVFPALALLSMREWRRGMAAGTFALAIFAVLFSFSRGSWIAFLAGLITFLALAWQKLPSGLRYFVLVGCAAATITIFLVPALRGRAASTVNFQEGSIAARLTLWKETGKVFRTSPILGVGLGNLASALSPGEPFRTPTNAHNLFLEIAAETGLVGLALFLGALGAALITFIRTQTLEAKGLASGLIVFMVHSLFETTLYSPQVLFVAAFLIGLASAVGHRVSTEDKQI